MSEGENFFASCCVGMLGSFVFGMFALGAVLIIGLSFPVAAGVVIISGGVGFVGVTVISLGVAE